MGAHNFIRDGFAHTLAPALTTAGYIFPNKAVDIEPQLYLSSDPHTRPFDLLFDTYPSIPPNMNHGCFYTSVGANITTSYSPPSLPINPTSPHVVNNIKANYNSHLQSYERRKLGQNNKRNPTT
jgi:hypothetical protein